MFRVAAVYVVAAWATIQVADILLPALLAPEWSLRFVILLTALGFPVAIVLAWIYDFTRAGILRTDEQETGTATPLIDAGANNRNSGHSLAVLPFVNIGGNDQDDYFSEGLAEDLLNALSRIQGLRVAARGSAFSFKNRQDDIPSIALQLGVGYVLEGSVRRAGEQLRVTVRLIEAATGFQLWSEVFDRLQGDIFVIQDEISRAVFAAFHGRFAVASQPAITPGTEDIEAYNLYLMGRHQFHKRTQDALQRAVDYFKQAIALDESFALPYTGLADAYALLSDSGESYGNLPLAEALEQAEPAIERALALDPALAEAHASQGFLRRLKRDLPGSESALRRALELNPSYPLAHVWLALTLNDQGRLRAALAEFERAYSSDPLSLIVLSNLGIQRAKFGQLEEGRRVLQRAIELDATFPIPYAGLAFIARLRNDMQSARRHWADAVHANPHRAYYPAMLGLMEIDGGDFAAASRHIHAAEALSPSEHPVRRAALMLLFASNDIAGLVHRAEKELAQLDDPDRRANAAFAALVSGDLAGAVKTYASCDTDLATYVTEAVTWSWRFPHGLLYAHALRHCGDRRAARAMSADIGERLDKLRDEGIRVPALDYNQAAVAVLEDRLPDAVRILEKLEQRGWQGDWWSRYDPVLQPLREQHAFPSLTADGAI